MDFIINHSGFLLGIAVVILLAIIGYYADKKDKSKIDGYNSKNDNKNNNISNDLKSNESLEQIPDVSAQVDNTSNNEIVTSNNEGVVPDIVSQRVDNVSNDSFLDTSEQVGSDEVLTNTNKQVGSDEVLTDTNKQVASNELFSSSSNQFGFNDFESLDMSLEDLEKKNFDKLSKSSLSEDDNFYYSDMEEGNESVLSQNNVSNDLTNVSSDESINGNDLTIKDHLSGEDKNETSTVSDVSEYSEQISDIPPANDGVQAKDLDEKVENSNENISLDEKVEQQNENISLDEKVENSNENISVDEKVENSNEDIKTNDSVDQLNDNDLDSSHIFDNETEQVSQSSDDELSNNVNDFSFMQNVQNDLTDSIPEIVNDNASSSIEEDNSESSINSDFSALDFENSVDEDIWKF